MDLLFFIAWFVLALAIAWVSDRVRRLEDVHSSNQQSAQRE